MSSGRLDASYEIVTRGSIEALKPSCAVVLNSGKSNFALPAGI